MKISINLLCVLIVILFTKFMMGNEHPRVLIDATDISVIKSRLADSNNVLLRDFYSDLREIIQNNWSNHTNPGTYQLNYPKYSNVAFLSLLENDSNIANIWKDNMISLALQFDTSFTQSGNHPSGSLFYANFFTIATALIYDYCYNRLNQIDKNILISRIEYGMSYIRPYVLNPENHYSWEYHNWQTRVPAGYILGGIAIAGDSPNYDSLALEVDLEIIRENLFFQEYPMFKYMFGDNGAYEEGAGYFGINFGRTFLSLIALSKYDGIDYFLHPIVSTALSNTPKWLIANLLPNRIAKKFVYNGLSHGGNSATIEAITNLLVISQKYNDRQARWLFNEALGSLNNIFLDPNHGRPEVFIPTLIVYENIEPLAPELNEFSPYIDHGRGLLNIRTGWGHTDLLFSIEANPAKFGPIVPGRNSQYDKGNITITKYGNNFIYDTPTIGNKTENNNYICIDGHGQSWGKSGEMTNSGRINSFNSYDFFEYIEIKTKNAFDSLYCPKNDKLHSFYPGLDPPEEWGYIFPVEEGIRTVLHLKEYENSVPNYFWIIDELREDSEVSEYDWHIFTPYYNTIDRTGNPITIARNGYVGKFDVYIIYPENYYTYVDTLDNIENPDPDLDDFILNTTRYDLAVKKLGIVQNSVSGHFNILLVPYDDTFPPYIHSYSQLQMTSGIGAKVAWNSSYEDFCFYSNTLGVQSSIITSNSHDIFIRKNTTNDKYIHYYMYDGSNLMFEEEQLVDLFGVSANVICDSHKVKILGENITNAKIYAPYASQLEINGVSSQYYRVNDYIHYGPILSDEEWSGTVQLLCDVTVGSQVNLTVDSGTTINFSQGTKLTVNGSALFEGTVGDSIIIESVNGQLGYGILIPELDLPNPAYIGLEYCKIKNLSVGIEALKDNIAVYNSRIENCFKGISISNTGAIINQNTLKNCVYGLYIENSTPSITENNISYCTIGIFILSGSGYFLNNKISICGDGEISFSGGFYAGGSSALYLENQELEALNEVTDNIGLFGVNASSYTNIFAGSSEEIIPANTFMDNDNYDMRAENASTIYAINNYWGPYGPDTKKLYIGEDCEIIYEPWLEEPPGELATRHIRNFSENVQVLEETGNPPLEVLGWKNIFINLFKNKKHLSLITQGKSILANLSSTKDINLLLSLMHHSSIIQKDSTYLSYLKTYLNNCSNKDLRMITSKLIIENYLNQNKIKHAETLISEILSSNPSSSLEVFALLKDFQISLYYKNDIPLAIEKLNSLKNIYKDHEYTILAKTELDLKNCNRNTHIKSFRKSNIDYESLDISTKTLYLSDNYPNPFNPQTSIKFGIPQYGKVVINIYNILGQKILSLTNEYKSAGEYQIVWYGKDDKGMRVSSGVYIYNFKYSSFDGLINYNKNQKMFLMK